MSTDIKNLLLAAGLDSTMFAATSRYYGKPLTTSQTPDGKKIVHTTRRFVPSSDRFSLLHYHFVEQGDRLDNLTYQYLADPEQFWKLCDANGVDVPDELINTIGKRIRITLPLDVPGDDGA